MPIDLNLEQCKLRKPDLPKLRELFRRLEFRSLLKRLPEDAVQTSLEFDPGVEVVESSQYRLVCEKSSLGALIAEIENAGAFALRINGSASHPINADALGVGISCPRKVILCALRQG